MRNCLLINVEGPSGIQTLEAITPKGDKLWRAADERRLPRHTRNY